MCELLGISALAPVTVGLSFTEFARHGGDTGPHEDGWGIAYFRDRDALLIREPHPAAESPFAAFIRDADFESKTVLSHIRKATVGNRTLANTQPFARELGGRMHLFAHNGALFNLGPHPNGAFRLLGETDSEHAFCILLQRLEAIWRADTPPSHSARVDVIEDFARVMRSHGIANFLYSDGELLIAHGHRRPRNHDEDPIVPGLHLMTRRCFTEKLPKANGLTLRSDCDAQIVTLVATVPLSDEPWTAFGVGELVVIFDGAVIERRPATSASAAL